MRCILSPTALADRGDPGGSNLPIHFLSADFSSQRGQVFSQERQGNIASNEKGFNNFFLWNV